MGYDDYDDDDLPAEPGEMFASIPGQPSYVPDAFAGRSPPIAEGLPDGATQFLVKMDVLGRPQELGRIGAKATVDDVIRKWFDIFARNEDATTLYFFPLDMASQMLDTQKPIVKDISPGHEAFRRIRQERAAGRVSVEGGAPAASFIDPLQLAGFVESKIEKARKEMEERLERERIALAEERARVAEERAKLDEMRVALTAESSDKTHQVYNKMFEITSERTGAATDAIRQAQSESTNAMVAMMTAMQVQQNASHQQTMQFLIAQQNLDRARAKDEAEERRKQHERDMERLRAEDDHRRDREAEAFTRQLNMDAAHNERVLALLKESRADDITKTIAKIGTALAAIGIDPTELDLKGLIGGFMSKGGIADAATSVVDKIVDGVIEIKKLEAANPKDEEDEEDEEDDPLVAIPMPDGTVIQIPQSQAEALMAQARAEGLIPENPQQPQQPQPFIPQRTGPGFVPPNPPPPQGGNGFQAPPAPPAQAQPEPKAIPFVNPPESVNPASGLAPELQVKGRRAAKKVAGVIKANAAKPDDEAKDLIMPVAFANVKDLAPYVKVVSIKTAFLEAGLDDALAERGLAILEATELVPAEVPRRPADLKAG